MAAIREVDYIPAQKTLLLCNRRFWQDQGIFGGGSATDLPISTIWYPNDGRSAEQPGVLLGSYSISIDAIRFGNLHKFLKFEELKRQLEKVHGLPYGYLDSVAMDWRYINWLDEPWSLGGFAFLYPEQRRLYQYAMTVPEYNNKIFFAGDHTSVLHGWINGSLQSAMKAANSLAMEASYHQKGE